MGEHHTFEHVGIEFYRIPAHMAPPGDSRKFAGCNCCDVKRTGNMDAEVCRHAICTDSDAVKVDLPANCAIYLTKQNFLDFRLTGHIPGESS